MNGQGLIVTAEHELALVSLAAPEPGIYEALVRIRACGICSTTDQELIRGTQPYNRTYPCLLGHEAIGEVIAIGSSVTAFTPGDLVTRPVGIWPGTTRAGLASAWGGFATFGIVRDRQAQAAAGDASLLNDYTALRQNRITARHLPLPALVVAISLAETLSWCDVLPPLAGKTVCVAGTGIAGLSIAHWAKQAGARQVIVLGRRAARLELARTLGADATCDTSAASWEETLHTAFGGIDIFCEAIGSAAMQHAGGRLLTPGGTLAIYGVPETGAAGLRDSDLSDGRRVITPEAREHLAYDRVCAHLSAGRIPVDRLLERSFPLARYAEAFAAVAAGSVVKAMLTLD